jgi:catechol 2,3-dioxygenase-like lactoylglutathione lyase family enzyme
MHKDMMMNISVARVHHIAVLVKDFDKARFFYETVLGFKQHHKVDSWFVINEELSIHIIDIPDAPNETSLYQEVSHVALEVDDLNVVCKQLLDHGLKPFQMDNRGNCQSVDTPDDALAYGIGTLFVCDPDGNTFEFIQQGRGIYTTEMRNQV